MPRQGEETFKYEYFVGLITTTLKDFLALKGPSQSGKKEGLVPKKFSQEEIYAKRSTNLDCINMGFKTPTRFLLSHGKITFTIGQMLMMVCFSAVDANYIGKYKDEKAYSYWMSGFVDSVFVVRNG